MISVPVSDSWSLDGLESYFERSRSRATKSYLHPYQQDVNKMSDGH